MPEDLILTLFRQLTLLMTAHSDTFEATGLSMFMSFATILLVWFGAKSMLAGAINVENLASMLMTIALGLCMMRFYTHPLPGIGTSFSHLIQDYGTGLANHLNERMVDNVNVHLSKVWLSLQTPSFSSVFAPGIVFTWVVVVLALFAAKMCLFFAISFGFICLAVCILVGPVFICFFICPGMEWMFWNWLKASLQFAFYSVIANAIVFVLGSLIIGFLDASGPDYSAVRLLALALPLTVLLGGFALSVLVIPPVLTSAIFSGHTGHVNVMQHGGGR